MADMLKMMKQATAMRKQMKNIQKELAKFTVEGMNGHVKVVAAGDMSIRSVTIDPAALDSGKVDRLQDMIVTAANNALRNAKKQAGSEMSKRAGGLGGLSDMLGM